MSELENAYTLVIEDMIELQNRLVRMKACVTDIDFCAIAVVALKNRRGHLRRS